jgi:DNA-binding transcriptional regulator YiaG
MDHNEFDLGKTLIDSAKQALAFKNGDKTKAKILPTPLFYSAKDIIRIREKYGLTQKKLAIALNVSTRTVEGWESGRMNPGGAASKLLFLLEQKEDFACIVLEGIISG